MRRLLQIAAFLFIGASAWVAYGISVQKNIEPDLTMRSIEETFRAKRHGSKFYMTVTAYPSNQKATYQRIPVEPLEWPRKSLDQIRDVSMWRAKLADGEAVTLMISLVEEDVPPWFTDDLVGTISIHMKNEHGKLVEKWSVAGQRDNRQKIENNKHIFELTSDEGCKYQLVFDLNI
jgi:hypothetical protein